MNAQFSSFGRRLLAMIIDGIILTSVLNILVMYTYLDMNLTSILIPFLYYVFCYTLCNGQTIGKNILSIRVIKTTNESISAVSAIIRTIGYYISAIPFGIGFLWAIWDKNKQTWHDKMANTYVIKTEKSSKRALCILLLIITIIAGGWSFVSNTLNSLQIENTDINSEKTLMNNNNTSVRSQLNLKYIKYDGSGDATIITKFNNPNLKDVSSGTEEVGENGVEVGDGNINIAGGDTITLDKKTNIYIKLITDTEAAAFIFTQENLDKFMKTEERKIDPFGFKQDPKDFIPLHDLKSSYSELSLEPGTYQLVIIPTEKAIQISSTIKIK